MDVLKTMLSPNPFKRNDPSHIHDYIALLMEQYWRSSAHSSVPLFAALQSGESSKFLAGPGKQNSPVRLKREYDDVGIFRGVRGTFMILTTTTTTTTKTFRGRLGGKRGWWVKFYSPESILVRDIVEAAAGEGRGHDTKIYI